MSKKESNEMKTDIAEQDRQSRSALAHANDRLKERIRELEALYNHELSCGRTVRESNRKLKGELQALREALMDALECIEGAAEGHGVDFYAYAKEIKALLPEEGT